MINGAHFLLYSKDPDADRAFFRDILKWSSVDLGHNWLIFRLPAAEMAVHPGSGDFVQQHGEGQLLGIVLYLMCDDLDAVMHSLEARGVSCSKVMTAEWGSSTTLRLPSGGEIGLYQPTHETAIGRTA
ncbi:MAG TPA: extradiol dioxygenase [Candidatus Angelobacter sp.]|nr:extradiol dioxygenase [Candidatus Angelobacter sp.]